jgi:phage terminase Nu1 subunit (DNA packaging protein)
MIVNRQTWCQIADWSSRYFDKAVAAGFPVKKRPATRQDDWQIDTVEGIGWLVAQRLEELGRLAAGEVLDLNAQRARLAKEQADRTAMENDRLRGRLLDADEVKQVMARYVGAANARLGGLPVKWSPIVRPDNPTEARRHLELAIEEVRADLRELCLPEEGDDARDDHAA